MNVIVYTLIRIATTLLYIRYICYERVLGVNMESKPFLMRMRDDVRVLLDGASKEQRRSRASIIEQLIRENLKQFEPTDNRLNRMLSNDGQN
jgi:hypothetical protein